MRKNSILLLCLSLVGCFMAGCDTTQTQQPSEPTTVSDSISIPSSDASASVNSLAESFIVKDVDGNDYDLASTPWGIKYPFMIDYFRDLLEVIRANGGDEAREADLCTNWSKTILPNSCITAFGAPATSLLGYDKEGNFDQNGPQITTTICSAVLEETTTLAPELLEAAFMEKTESQYYLTVELTIENTGGEDVEFTLNGIRPYVFVDGERASANISISEMMSASNTGRNVGDSSFFHCTLAPGQLQDYTVVFYADHRIKLEDIYLELNYSGLYVAPTPTEDPFVFTQTGMFCALK